MVNNSQINPLPVNQQNVVQTAINLPGDNNTLIAHADNVNEYNQTIFITNSAASVQQQGSMPVCLNTDYFNLIVVAGDVLDKKGYVMVDKERAITECTSDELKQKYAALTPDAVAEIKTFPAIIATENHDYGKTDDQHMAHYGIITDIKVQDNGIKVYYQLLNEIPQQRLNEILFELGILGNSNFNEFNRMHWAIKRINMIDTLAENGIRVFRLQLRGGTSLSTEYEKMNVEKWVNIEDVANHLSLSQDTVRIWIKEGKLPVYKAGKRYKFKISEVDEWVREGKIKEQ